MLAPSLVGYDMARTLSADPGFQLPIVSHPTFGGTNVITPTTGFSHHFYFGLLSRLMGVDAVVYPNFGGRFGFSREECRSIANGCSDGFGSLKPSLPAPGGGMTWERLSDMQAVCGDDIIYPVGGALLREKGDLQGACNVWRLLSVTSVSSARRDRRRHTELPAEVASFMHHRKRLLAPRLRTPGRPGR